MRTVAFPERTTRANLFRIPPIRRARRVFRAAYKPHDTTLGGEGIAYHDADAINHGSGELNYKPEQCEAGVPAYVCHFRENEGVDISYVEEKT